MALWPVEWRALVADSWELGENRVGHWSPQLHVVLNSNRQHYFLRFQGAHDSALPEEFKAWLGLANRGPEYTFYELLPSYSVDHPRYRRLVLCFAASQDPVHSLNQLCERLTQRLRLAFANNARLAVRCSVISMYDQAEQRLYLVCQRICVAGSRTVKAIGKFLDQAVDGAASFVEEWGNSEHSSVPLPNSGFVTIVGARNLDDNSVLPPLSPGSELVSACQACIRVGSPAEAGYLADITNRRQPWSEQMKRFADRLFSEPRRDRNQLDQLNEARDNYRTRLQQTSSTRIDLGCDLSFFKPYESAGRHGPVIRRAIDSDTEDFIFEEARSMLDQLFAYNPVTNSMWYKKVDPHGRPQIEEVKNPKEFFRHAGYYHTLSYPTDQPVLDSILREVLIGKNYRNQKNPASTFDFFEWYVEFGMRREQGTVFMPLELGHNRLTAVPGYINQWRGFRAHKLLSEPHDIISRLEARNIPDIREENDLGFLLRHFSYMMGEAPEDVLQDIARDGGLQHATGQFFGWLANMIFFTVEKKPRFYILQSPPGCGKSSTINALSKRLLHEAHFNSYTDVARLMEQFNGHAGLNVLTLLEEVDLNDMKNKGLRMMQELVSCGERYQRMLFREGEMVKDYRYFIVCTNVQRPIVLPPGQRRAVLARFYNPQALRLEDPQYRKYYDTRLARVLSQDETWREFAYLLHTRYNTPEGREAVRLSCYSARVFNHATLQLQFESLRENADTSVLGWLYLHLVNFDDFFDGEGKNVYVWNPDDSSKDLHEWRKLGDFAVNHNDSELFTGRWRDTSTSPLLSYKDKCIVRRRRTHNWWVRNDMEAFYESYRKSVPLHAQLPQREFVDVCKHIFQSHQLAQNYDSENINAVYMYETTYINKHGRTVEEWALAPLQELEEAFKSAMPNTGELDWDEYRRKREELRVRSVRNLQQQQQPENYRIVISRRVAS